MLTKTVIDLQYRQNGNRVDLSRGNRRTSRLERLAVKKLEHWNLCAMNPTIKSSPTEKLECTSITLQFQGKHLADRFLDCLVRLQHTHIEREGGRIGVHGPLSSNALPSPLQARSPTTLGSNAASSSSFVSLPHISPTEPLDTRSLFRVSSESRRVSVAVTQVQELEESGRVMSELPAHLGSEYYR